MSRWIVPLLALALVPAAQAQTGPAAPPSPANCAQSEARFPALIGQRQADVETALRAMPGIATLRAGGPTAPMTMDYREDRVTLTVVDGRVTRIICG